MSAAALVRAVDAAALVLPRLSTTAEQNAGGEPSVGQAALFTIGDAEVGVWEMGVGAMYDIESDEIFVVLAGEATVEVLDDSGLVTTRTEVRPGVVCALTAGTRTRWTVRRTLRKIYVA